MNLLQIHDLDSLKIKRCKIIFWSIIILIVYIPQILIIGAKEIGNPFEFLFEYWNEDIF